MKHLMTSCVLINAPSGDDAVNVGDREGVAFLQSALVSFLWQKENTA